MKVKARWNSEPSFNFIADGDEDGRGLKALSSTAMSVDLALAVLRHGIHIG